MWILTELIYRWDDWVVEDRLRKLTDENRELATHIRREAESSQRLKNAKGPSKKRAMSDRSSVRDSEERGNSTSGRPNKRVRENEIEKVSSLTRIFYFPLLPLPLNSVHLLLPPLPLLCLSLFYPPLSSFLFSLPCPPKIISLLFVKLGGESPIL